MGLKSLVCTGCGTLCDDIKVEIEDSRPAWIENACAKGTAHIQSSFNAERRPECTIRGQECSSDRAIAEAKHLLLNSRNPLIFGLDNSTLSAQALGIELAQKIKGTIDDASSFSYGLLIKAVLDGDLPTCSLSEIKDNADLLVYWGADPPNTHPRHLSVHSYYAYTGYNPAGWYPKVTLTCVDVRRTELASISRPVFRIEPGGDKALVKTIRGEARDEVETAAKFVELVKKSKFCVVFAGLGLMHGLGSDFGSFVRMIQMLSGPTRIAVIPMTSEINMRGFGKLLHEKTGRVNAVSFAPGEAHESRYMFLDQITKQPPECVMIIGSDPFSALPHSVVRNLAATEIICLSHFATPSSMAAQVVIPTALPGVESGGSVLRMDGTEVALAELEKGIYPTEEVVLRQLVESI